MGSAQCQEDSLCPSQPPWGRGVILELAPTFSSLRAPAMGWFSILPPAQYDRQRAIPWTVSNKGKCRTSLLLPVLLCELGRAELRFFLQRGKESRWGEEKELALLLAFQSRNGFYLPLFRMEQSLVRWDSKEQGKGECGSPTSTALQDWESVQNWL